jgi:hypothetical protein
MSSEKKCRLLSAAFTGINQRFHDVKESGKSGEKARTRFNKFLAQSKGLKKRILRITVERHLNHMGIAR